MFFLKRYCNLTIPCLFKGKSNKIATTATLLLAGIDTWAATYAPKFLGALIQHYQQADFTYVIRITISLILCRGINNISPFLHHIIFFRVVNRAIRDIRMKVIMQLHKIPWHLQKAYKMGEVINVTNRVSPSLRVMMNTLFATIIPTLLKVVTLSITMIHTSRITWYFPILVGMTYIYVFFGMRKLIRSRYSAWEISDDVAIATTDSLNNTKFAKYHLELEEKRLRKLFDQEEKKWERNNADLYTIKLVQSFLFVVITGVLTLHMVSQLRAGSLTLAEFTTINGCMYTMYRSIANVTERTRVLLTGMVDIDKALKILDLAPQYANKLCTTPSNKKTMVLFI